MKKTSTCLPFLILLLCFSGGNNLLAQSPGAGKITESLWADLEASPDAYHRAYVLLADRVHPREMEA
ncbi:MAG: hypothetical protein KDD28_09605, partial [Phaeodactylibacter sp.]|nr:hypothetical protein [Phaeodactylibacter sp.]